MDPAGTSACAHNPHNLDGSDPHTLCNAGSEARIGLPELDSPEPRPEYGLEPTEADLREEKAAELARKSKDQYGWRRIIRNFTPSYG